MVSTDTFLDFFIETREHTEAICKPLEIEDYVVQPIIDVSPPKWHLGHQQHIGSHFNYPEEALAKRISGRVSIMFTIDEEGNVGEIKTKGPSPILENEARRIISLLPKFHIGSQNGVPKKVPYSIPINFKL